MSFDPLWRLKLRYGRLTTPYTSVSVIADGVPSGGDERGLRGFLSMSAWVLDNDQALELLRETAGAIDFHLDGRIYFYKATPDRPPLSAPYAYASSVNTYPANERDDDPES